MTNLTVTDEMVAMTFINHIINGNDVCMICGKEYKHEKAIIKHIINNHSILDMFKVRKNEMEKEAKEKYIETYKSYLQGEIEYIIIKKPEKLQSDFMDRVEKNGYTSAMSGYGKEMVKTEEKSRIINNLKNGLNKYNTPTEQLEFFNEFTGMLRNEIIRDAGNLNSSTCPMSNLIKNQKLEAMTDLLGPFGSGTLNEIKKILVKLVEFENL